MAGIGSVAGLLTLSGCGGSDPAAETSTPAEAAAQLDAAFQPPAQQDESTTEPVYLSVQTASEALREGNYEKAVVALQTTRQSATPLTFDQGMAVQNSLISLEQHLINAAANGDANAQRAYDLLKKSKRN